MAVKVIDKSKIKDKMNMLEKEIFILNMLDHQNIVKYYETYNDNRYVYLVMQFISGKTLTEKLAERPSFATEYMRGLMRAVSHCHV